MRQCVKALRLFTILLLLSYSSQAQFKSILQRQDLLTGIQRVIEDYPNQFKNITGEMIVQNPQSTDYKCTVKMDNTEESYITKYTSGDKEIYSWQALVLTTENFDNARQKFKSIYNQLNNRLINGANLKGTPYEAPAEEKRFTNALFSFSPADESNKRLKVELVMESEMMDWKIKLLIYSREREDDEKGAVNE